MSFGTIIKKLRREHDLTQEELAETLSISPQAISRWETEAAMPDISLLPTLCNYFNVSSDMLLGIDLEKKKEKIEEILDEAGKYSSRGYYDKAVEILSAGLREYPDSFAVMRDLMYVRYWQYNNDKSQIKFRDEAVKLGETILAKSTDDSLRESAIQILCFSYRDEGRTEEAVKLADSMSCIAISNEMLRSSIYSGDKGYDAKQTETSTLFQFLSNALTDLLWARHDSGEYIYTDEEKAALREKRIALIRLFFEDGNLGFYHTHLCDTYRDLAIYFAKKGDIDQAVESLRAASEHAISFDKTESGGEYTCLAFRKKRFGGWIGSDTDNNAAILLKQLDDTVFDGIRGTTEFADIKVKLINYADKWQVK